MSTEDGAQNEKDLKSSFGQISMLNKGDEVNLEKLDPTLKHVIVGVGWSAPPENEGFPVDLDASAFILNRDGRVRRDTDFVFYNNLDTDGGVVKHTGDNTTGDADGDDEAIELDLENMGFDVEKVAFAVTIHNAEERQQTFGLVKEAYIRIVNKVTGQELAHFDLTEDASSDNAIIFGELERDGAGWKFKAMGTGSDGGLFAIARDYGVNVAPN
ncbi:MAG: TerD family protein [Alphaproteobacteria bacterium]|jgi:tellurium resistance protein TerD